MIYPPAVLSLLENTRQNFPVEDATASGADAKLDCGCFVRVFLTIDDESISDLSFQSSGCGYMLSSVHALLTQISGRALSDLHGLSNTDLETIVLDAIGEAPADRRACVSTAIRAVRASFADLRARRIEEFSGEKALVCTCFGVTEERIESLAASGEIHSLESAAVKTSAGTGCGSCRLIIEEILAGNKHGEAVL